MGILLVEIHLQLVFAGHNNDLIWYTAKQCPGRGWYWDTPKYIPDSYTSRAPAATMHRWDDWTGLTVAYRGTRSSSAGSTRIYYRVKRGTNWTPEYVMPEEVITSNAPEIISFNRKLYVFYRGHEQNNRIYVARKEINRPSHTGWEFPDLDRAFTRRSRKRVEKRPGVFTIMETGEKAVSAVIYEGSLLVAYVGHNNPYIWLRRSNDGVEWERLGYIRNVTTIDNPSLTVSNLSLYLAFKPVGVETEICVGSLELEEGVTNETPGHTWTSIRTDRPDLNCGSE